MPKNQTLYNRTDVPLHWDALVLTCEHAVNSIPSPFDQIVSIPASVLNSHRGYDKGALQVTRDLEEYFGIAAHTACTTRLLIDYNRSLHHPEVYSSFSRKAPDPLKLQLQQHYYQPFRTKVLEDIQSAIGNKKRVLHLSVHSFTPVMHGKQRSMELGLLYDPNRPNEALLARYLQTSLKDKYKVALNLPYRGWTDGHTTHLRKIFARKYYMGLELEINQKCARDPSKLQRIAKDLAGVLNLLKS